MKILLSAIPFDNGKSGISVYIREVVKALEKANYDLTLIVEDDAAQEFEPIQRIIKDTDPNAMLEAYGQEAAEHIRKVGEKYYVNLKALNACSLRSAGVTRLDISTDCTMCQHHRFWSHRITGDARGSQGAIIVCKGGTL